MVQGAQDQMGLLPVVGPAFEHRARLNEEQGAAVIEMRS